MSNLYEEVNPVYNTAKTTLHQLVQAGVAEAAEFEKALLELEPEKGAFSADEKVFSEGHLCAFRSRTSGPLTRSPPLWR